MKYIGVIGIFIITVLGFYYFNSKPTPMPQPAVTETPTSPTPATTQMTSFTASFEIYTLGTKRIFTDPKYHNQSEDIYVEASDPSVVHIEKSGLTWSSLFETLPMSLSKDCLVTGTGQTFCSNGQKLRFFLNGQENPDALDTVIMENDRLEVRYGG